MDIHLLQSTLRGFAKDLRDGKYLVHSLNSAREKATDPEIKQYLDYIHTTVVINGGSFFPSFRSKHLPKAAKERLEEINMLTDDSSLHDRLDSFIDSLTVPRKSWGLFSFLSRKQPPPR